MLESRILTVTRNIVKGSVERVLLILVGFLEESPTFAVEILFLIPQNFHMIFLRFPVCGEIINVFSDWDVSFAKLLFFEVSIRFRDRRL